MNLSLTSASSPHMGRRVHPASPAVSSRLCRGGRVRRAKGFTLIELITVAGILVLLISLAVPAIKGMAGAQGVTAGVHDVANFMELARNEAMARRTYVWVGVSGTTTAAGNQELLMGAAFSADGTGTASNLKPFTKVIHVRNVALVKWADLKQKTRDLFPAGGVSICGFNSNTSFLIGTTLFQNQTLIFTPRGEALLSADATAGYSSRIDVSFRQAQGANVSAQADDAAVLIDGATGTTTIVQL